MKIWFLSLLINLKTIEAAASEIAISYQDNVHVREGVLVPCSQISYGAGASGTLVNLSKPAAPTQVQ